MNKLMMRAVAMLALNIADAPAQSFMQKLGKEVKKEEVGAYEPEKVVVEGAGTDGVKYVYIKKK